MPIGTSVFFVEKIVQIHQNNHMIYIRICFLILLCGIIFILPQKVMAGDLVQFHTSNIQFLSGNNYELGESQRTTATLEHANGWLYGDTYGFVDFVYSDGENSTYYGEISPRLSLGKITKKDMSYGIIKDILLSTTFEKARGQGPQYLYGGAIDFNLSGFKFFKTNAYVHDSTQLDGKTWQVTLAWNRPLNVGRSKFLIEGFADLQGHEGTSNSNQLLVPRFLFDVGHALGTTENKLWAGVEYQYWHNKFGVDGVTESAPQAQLKWIF